MGSPARAVRVEIAFSSTSGIFVPAGTSIIAGGAGLAAVAAAPEPGRCGFPSAWGTDCAIAALESSRKAKIQEQGRTFIVSSDTFLRDATGGREGCTDYGPNRLGAVAKFDGFARQAIGSARGPGRR